MAQFLKKKIGLTFGLVSAMALASIIKIDFPAAAELSSGSVKQQTAQKQSGIREGQVIVSGSRGQYTGKLLVRATPAAVWAVLTDYDNYEKFLPDVAESKILQSSGNKKVFEQVKVIQAILFSRKSTVRIEVTETYPQKILFRMTSGELKSLQGQWTLDYPTSRRDNQPTQILVTHQVAVDPGAKSWRGIFYGIYEDSLEETLQAINQEIERRSQTNQ